MSSLIEGWFMPMNGRPYGGDQSESTPSSQRSKSYLTLYDSYAAIGPTPTSVSVDCELRTYSPGLSLDDTLIQAHGRFIIKRETGEPPHLDIELHHFAVVKGIDPTDPDLHGLRTSVTQCGRVISTTDTTDLSADRYIMLEVSEYVRDQTQTSTVQCRLNRSSGNKRWQNTILPAVGSMILISGFLAGDMVDELFIEVETMNFLPSSRPGDVSRSPDAPRKTIFGSPQRSSQSVSDDQRAKAPAVPLSMLPVPTMPTNQVAGPSTTKGKRAVRGRNRGRVSTPTDPPVEDTDDETEVSPTKRTRR